LRDGGSFGVLSRQKSEPVRIRSPGSDIDVRGLQAFVTRREGHTAVRAGTSEQRAADAADAAVSAGTTPPDAAEDEAAAATVYATGIDDFDVAVDVEGQAVDVEAQRNQAAGRCLSSMLREGGVLVSASADGAGLLSDYDRDFAPLTHPTVFPHGEGGRPAEGMSEDAYFRLILARWAARGRGDNVGMLLSFYDIQTRHAVNSTTHARARATPDVFARLDGLRREDMARLFAALCAGARPRPSPAARLWSGGCARAV
jgi:hypothetical protein